MSKIFDYENQFILRVPESIADKLNKIIDNEDQKQNFLDLIPYVENDETGDCLKFKFNFDGFQSKASLVDLPCIIESQKTLDGINVFKSNDISQMILVHPNNEESLEKVPNIKRIGKKSCIVPDKYKRFTKYLSGDGLTEPTKNIRKKFFRKKVIMEKEAVEQVELSLIDIIKDLSKQKNEVSQQGSSFLDEGKKIKRKYKRKF